MSAAAPAVSSRLGRLRADAIADQPRLLHAPSEQRELGAAGGRASRSGGGRLTLEQLLGSVWEGLHADGAAECPLCHGRMSRTGAGAGCDDCGSALG